jgi:nucleoside 2-deoxyribosyltransferase
MTDQNKSPKKRVYVAAPLFTPYERALNEKISSMLQLTFETFLPQRDGILLPGQKLSSAEFSDQSVKVYESDRLAITSCEIVFAILDGRVVDEGVAFELGYGAALGKCCIGFRTDTRVLLPNGHNPMIQSCLTLELCSETALLEWISQQRVT